MGNNNGNFVKTGGFRTYYLDEGSGDPVILLHGGGAGADGISNWSKCLPLFAKRKRTIVADLVGFGHTDAPDPANFTYSQESRNDQIIAFIEALGLERVSIVGNSMGGATAMGVAMRRPDLVSNLILMGSAGVTADAPQTEEAKAAFVNLMGYDFTPDGMRRVISALANPGYQATEDQVQYRYELSVQPHIRAAYSAVLAWVRENSLDYKRSDIAQIKTRTLVFNGKDDLVCPIANAYLYLQLLENSTGYLVPHCRHWAMLEYPDLFSSVTLDFLDDYQAGS
ncbi:MULTISPECIES: alpha/beta hydrolase [unclassified Mycobacterium]|uniref:alpha/beta fold hydrolase n=1 Tax=unclassified Mycobacterium TaxID=2642494 RepID=UPI0029C7CF18|nr:MULTISPECIES: alpha/beta hydrolase [unclassified Mycobacterium]